MKVEQPPITAWKGCLVVKTDVLTLDGNATMETYLLDRPYGPALLPMAVICPGGGYLDCSPTEGECVALRFNNRNCHAAVLHYATAKSAPGHSHFPRPLEDLAEAICLIRRNARDWGVDPDRIVIVGFSAGAHLCALYSSYWNRKLLQAKGSPRQLLPNAVILGYPLADEFMNRSDMQKKLQQEIDMERITGEKSADTASKTSGRSPRLRNSAAPTQPMRPWPARARWSRSTPTLPPPLYGPLLETS